MINKLILPLQIPPEKKNRSFKGMAGLLVWGFAQKMFELCSKNTASLKYLSIIRQDK